jgi:GTP cyclohydrolase IA
MEDHVRSILKAIGEDPKREGLVRTPERVAEALKFLTQGYQMDPEKVINDALFTEDYEEMIVQKDIDFYSLCEHHMLPFFGKAHVAYIPHHKIVGISKLARLVDVYARRLQVQERMNARRGKTKLLRDYQLVARRVSYPARNPQRIHDSHQDKQ